MMNNEAANLIKQAEEHFKSRRLDEAFQFYQEAAFLCEKEGDAAHAADCFARAAMCEKVRTGFESLLESAQASEAAARQAVKAGNYAFARWYYRDAAMIYEREGDFEKYSFCYIESQHAFVAYLWFIFHKGKRQIRNSNKLEDVSPAGRIEALVRAFFGVVSRFIWGYGERPFRVFFAGGMVVMLCATIYWLTGSVAGPGLTTSISFLDALYFSGVTFSTLGYGDFVPVGMIRLLAIGESLTGFILVPLFVVALSRHYLRVYR